MDGQQTLLYVRRANKAYKLAEPLPNAFDTDWLHRIANLSATLTNELVRAQRRGWKLNLAEQTGADGRLKSIVTVHAKSGLPADTYPRNNYFESADTRRVYRFDAQTERLETVQMYVARDAGEVQVFEISQIDYDQPIDPSVWKLAIAGGCELVPGTANAARQ